MVKGKFSDWFQVSKHCQKPDGYSCDPHDQPRYKHMWCTLVGMGPNFGQESLVRKRTGVLSSSLKKTETATYWQLSKELYGSTVSQWRQQTLQNRVQSSIIQNWYQDKCQPAKLLLVLITIGNTSGIPIAAQAGIGAVTNKDGSPQWLPWWTTEHDDTASPCRASKGNNSPSEKVMTQVA